MNTPAFWIIGLPAVMMAIAMVGQSCDHKIKQEQQRLRLDCLEKHSAAECSEALK